MLIVNYDWLIGKTEKHEKKVLMVFDGWWFYAW